MHCSKDHFPKAFAHLKEHFMTNLFHKAAPVTINDRIAEGFSAVTLALSVILALVTLATV